MKKIGGLITAIEDAGIEVISARWLTEGHLEIQVETNYRNKTIEIAHEYRKNLLKNNPEWLGLSVSKPD